ncbi:MAG: two-component regulator propeller domain-containing protein [Fibrobacterota bacterium]
MLYSLFSKAFFCMVFIAGIAFGAYDVETFAQSDGLPSESIFCVNADNDGNVWIGTDSGLACFRDGSFEVYTKESTDSGLVENGVYRVGIAHNKVYAIDLGDKSIGPFSIYDTESDTWLEPLSPVGRYMSSLSDKNDTIVFTWTSDWSASPYLGIISGDSIKNNDDFNYSELEYRLSASAVCNGNIILGGEENRIYTCSNDSIRRVDSVENFEFLSVLHGDSDGRLWAGDGLNSRVAFREDGNWNAITAQSGVICSTITDICSFNKTVCIAGPGAVQLFRNGDFIRNFRRNSELPDGEIRDITIDTANAIWVATTAGVARIKTDEDTRVTSVTHQNSGFTVSKNTDKITIHRLNDDIRRAEVALYTTTGRRLFNERVSFIGGSHTINTGTLRDQALLLRIYGENNGVVTKIIQ